MSGGAVRLRVAPGAGLVARFGDGVLVADVDAAGGAPGDLVAVLRDACEGRDRPGRVLIQRLAQHLVEVDAAAQASFAALAPAEDGWAVGLHGDVDLWVVRGDDGERLSGRQAVTWVDRLIAGGFDRLVVAADPAGLQAPAAPFDLEAGVVPGAGVVVAVEAGEGVGEAAAGSSAVAPVPAGTGATAPQPAVAPPDAGEAGEAGDAGDAGDAGSGAGDAPVVTGVLCANEHFNHPQARYCSVCGVAMLHRTRAPVQRPRPPLGVVVTDDGTTYTLDTDHVVGRDPEEDPAVAQGRAHALRLDDDELSVSRVHAGIRLEGWDVMLVDRGSANGTFVADPEAGEWRRLEPDAPEALAPGARIAFGRRTATFASHHQA